MGISRRGLLQGLLLAQARTKGYITDKKQLVEIFDREGVNVEVAAQEVTVKVDSAEVTGTEGGQVIFKFDRAGRLIQMVVWNEGMKNEGAA